MTDPVDSDDAQRRLNRSRTLSRGAEVVWILVLGVVAALVLYGAAISSLALSDTFCSLCHTQERATTAGSSHQGVSCDACHGSTNFFGVADRRLAQVGMVTAAFVPGSQAIALPIDNATCLSCHETGLRKVSVGNGIRMSHKQVIDAKWACSTCHPDVAHRRGGEAATRGYSMDMCLKCHGMDPTNVKACDKCHVKGQNPSLAKQTSWRLTHGPDWRTTHGLGDLTTCKSCHPPEKCVSCHGMELPHNPGFREQHGRFTVLRPTGAEDCYVCHDRSACISCHGLEMPHPENFLPGHKALVKKSGRDVCYRCHEKSSCDACHARHAHPGLKPEHRRWLEAHPTTGGTR